MNATQRLHGLGQSLWLDNISRGLLKDGTLSGYIEDLAVEDLTQAADLFRPTHDATGGVDGWVSLEVSPLLANDTLASIRAAAQLHGRAQRPNLYVKIPGTPARLPAIEESIFAGVPVNVTLLFSREQYLAAAEAYMRGIERRIAAGRDPKASSVASIFVSRWDVAVKDKIPQRLRNRLGISIALRTYNAYPELLAFADHGTVKEAMPFDGGQAEAVLADFAGQGVDVQALAVDLQREGTAAFAESWRNLLAGIAAKSAALAQPKSA
jgi:transaldolase